MHIQFAELPVFDQDRAKTFYTKHCFRSQVGAIRMGRRRMAMDRTQISRQPKRRCTSSDAAMTRHPRQACTLVLVATVEVEPSRTRKRCLASVEIPHRAAEAPWQPGRTDSRRVPRQRGQSDGHAEAAQSKPVAVPRRPLRRAARVRHEPNSEKSP